MIVGYATNRRVLDASLHDASGMGGDVMLSVSGRTGRRFLWESMWHIRVCFL
eukprot:COSAG01_NODE_780_length_13660_cov_171.194233_11_plen_52_part_00